MTRPTKKRATTQGKAFRTSLVVGEPSKEKPYNQLPRRGLYTSEMQYFDGKDALSRGTSMCFTVVFQAKKGSRGKPKSVVWHISPMSMGKANEEIVSSHRKRLLDKLASGKKIQGGDVMKLRADHMVNLVLDHMENVKEEGAKVTATILPGMETLKEGKFEEKMEDMKKILEKHKSRGHLHNIRTRGATAATITPGSFNVHVDGKSGKINRY